MSSKQVLETGNGIIQTGNGIIQTENGTISSNSWSLIEKLLLHNHLQIFLTSSKLVLKTENGIISPAS